MPLYSRQKVMINKKVSLRKVVTQGMHVSWISVSDTLILH